MVYYDRYMYLKISRLYWSILGMLYFTQFRMVINKLYPDRPYNTFSPLNSVNIIQLLLVLPELSFLFLFFFLLKVTIEGDLFRHISQFNYLVISIFWIIPYQLASRNPVCFEDFFLEGGGGSLNFRQIHCSWTRLPSKIKGICWIT